MSHKLNQTTRFSKLYKKLTKNNKSLKRRIRAVTKNITDDPFSPNLKTHKVNTSKFGLVYSSRVTGDVRIIWKFIDNRAVILFVSVGGHEGKRSVYI